MACPRHRVAGCLDIAGVMQKLQDEQEAVQKRTFTKWINSHLAKHKPPLEVNDLFEDIKDGLKLLALLEVLSGQRLPCEQGRQLKRIHWLSNIGTALKFLEGRKIKLVNIHATDIADGRPSIVLGLIWTVILYFQIEELTSNLPALQALSASNSSVESSETGSPPMKRKVVRFQGNAKKALLKWVQATAARRHGIEVKDFGPSWRDGVAFQAVVHAVRPDLVDMQAVRRRSNKDNLEEAFALAENELGIPRLLDPEDVDVDKPDEKSIMTYVAQFLKLYPDPRRSDDDGQRDEFDPQDIEQMLEREERKMLRELKVFLDQLERDVLRAQAGEGNLTVKYQAFKNLRAQYEMTKKQTDLLLRPPRKDGKLSVEQALLKQAWERLSLRLLDWHIHLDKSLPGPLGAIGAWLHRAEMALREEIPVRRAHDETADLVRGKLEQHKDILNNLESHRQPFQQIHRDRSVNGVPVPPEQLQDMAERFHSVSASRNGHLIKLEFWESKYRLTAFLLSAESKLKSWIVKYGRRDSVELLMQSYVTFVEGHKFFERYEILFDAARRAADVFKSETSVEEAEEVNKFLSEAAAQWKNLALEVRSVRSMLEEVTVNWDKYAGTVEALQAWLEDAENMLNQSEGAKRDFFSNLPRWVQQHTDMNDAGNFLIETCDDLVSRDLKQQLLLLNGRWRELFVKVKYYARADEVDKLRYDYQDGLDTLKMFMDATDEKMNAAVQVSFLNVRAFVQEVEEIKHKVPAVEAACKAAARAAQLLSQDTPPEEAAQMTATIASVKERLGEVREQCLPLLKESQSLLAPLEEMEKNITGFYRALEKAGRVTGGPESEGPTTDFRDECRELAAATQSCKTCLLAIEKNHQNVLKLLDTSPALRHMDTALLEKRVADIQASSQATFKEASEWRKRAEANSGLMKRFEESRLELEKVLDTAESRLTERGDPEELLKKQAEFLGQLDQRVLNAFLKACDELTDILPEKERLSLQETVRGLHKRWKDAQSEAPLLSVRLKAEAEGRRLALSLRDCIAEVNREKRRLVGAGSERLIKEHREFFSEKGPQSVSEKRLQAMEELCQELPERDSAHKTLEKMRKEYSEVSEEIENTHQTLMEHQDKWKDYNARYAELSCWLISKESQLRLMRNRAADPRKYAQVKASVTELRNDAELQEGNLNWLKARMAVLTEIGAVDDVRRQGSALGKLSADLKALLTSLVEAEKTVLAVGDCVQFREEVQTTLEDLLQAQKEAQGEVAAILDCTTVREAQQLLLVHQQLVKRLKLKRKDVHQLISRGQQLQVEEGPGETLQQDLQSLENTLGKMEQSMDSQEQSLQVTLEAWQEFESQQDTVRQFVCKVQSGTEPEPAFSSPESLAVELERARALLKQCEAETSHVQTLLKRAGEIQLGPNSKALLLQRARSLTDQVDRAEAGIRKDVQNAEEMKSKWDDFRDRFQAFSSWLSNKEEQVDAMKASALTLEQQMAALKDVETELQDRTEVLPRLEAESRDVLGFVSSGEAARMKARLTQTGRYWDELRENVRQLGVQLLESESHRQKFWQSFQEAQAALRELQPKLGEAVEMCTSSSDTYKVLQNHTDSSQELEKLKESLLSLSAGARRLGDVEGAATAVEELSSSLGQIAEEAKQKQSALETLLALWQSFEKQRGNFISCLERSEGAVKSESRHMSADRSKLCSELRDAQARYKEVEALGPAHAQLLSVATSLYGSVSEDTVRELSEELDAFRERLRVQNQALPQRTQELQDHLSLVEQFEQDLDEFSQWSENTLSALLSVSEIQTGDLSVAREQVKESLAALEMRATTKESLDARTEILCRMCEPGEKRLLRGRADGRVQPYLEARRLLLTRSECLESLEGFSRTLEATTEVLRGLRHSAEDAGGWEELQQELSAVVPDARQLETLAADLDAALRKSRLRIGEKSCRARADALGTELDAVGTLLGAKRSEAEASAALRVSFRERRERLLKAVEDVQEKARGLSLEEPGLLALQQRSRFFSQLEDELQSQQHEGQWLRDKVGQLARRDATLGEEAQEEMALLEVAWDDAKRLLAERKEQCDVIVDLLKEYETLKSSVGAVAESAEPLLDIAATLTDHEETKRALGKHEAAKARLADTQPELERFSETGKQLAAALKKVPECDWQTLKQETETLVDRWLDVSERVDENHHRLKQTFLLWEDVRQMADDVESWSAGCVTELNESLDHLDDSHKLAAGLTALQEEISQKELRLETLHGKIAELKSSCQSQESPPKLQLLASDLEKKMDSVRKLHGQALGNLLDFCSRKKVLEDYISQMFVWLKSTEDTFVSSPAASDSEEVCRVKELQKELENQQGSIDSTRENLNNLCRKFPSEELSALGSALTELIKTYESVNQLAARTLATMQNRLRQQFDHRVQEFHGWLLEQKEIVKECCDRSGDAHVVERKLQKLKGAAERIEEGEAHLTQVCEEGEKLLLHLPKANAGQVQQQLSSIQQDWDGFVERCRHNRQILEDSASLVKGFEDGQKKLEQWLTHMENRVNADLPQAVQSSPEKALLQQVEEYQQEVLKQRDCFERLCQEARALNEGGRGDGGETRVSAQLEARHRALLRRAGERLRAGQVAEQERRAFQETLRATRTWLSGVQERLASLDSTLGNKETLEQRLLLVQDILLMKGEGEVKLNMTVGKGEQVLKHYGTDGQEAVALQLQELKDAWANMLIASMSCHSRLEWTVSQWSAFLDGKNQLQQWMESVEQEVVVTLPRQPGLKEKSALLARLRAVRADVDARAAALSRLTDKSAELYEKSADQTFGPESRAELQAHFADISAVVQGKIQSVQSLVSEHERYLDAVRDFNDWLTSAKEELQRWSDLSGDSASLQRKLSKVQELLDSKQQGRERLARVQTSGAAARDHTAAGGYEAIEREEAALSSGWEQWEAAALRAHASLETALSQSAASELEFQALSTRLDRDTRELGRRIHDWRLGLGRAEGQSEGGDAVEGWRIAKDILEELAKAEPACDSLKTQLNDLCRFSRDMAAQSERVSALVKEYNSLSLRAARECQNKEKLQEQAFRSTYRDFQQWLVNTKINTAKCFDAPQSLSEALLSLQKIQELVSDRELGQSKLNGVVAAGELLSAMAAKDKVESVRTKISKVADDWKNTLSGLHDRELHLQNLASQMKDFESSAEPLREFLEVGEVAVQESGVRLHDLPAKKDELHKLQGTLEELESQQVHLNRLKDKAQRLSDQHAAGKAFAHRVSQLSARFLALTNLTKEKASRMERVMHEHQLFKHGLEELQNWVADTSHVPQTYCVPTADKNVLESRLVKLEALLTARQEKEIQLKMLITRGESVQRNTSAEGAATLREEIQELKDSWDALLSACIQCKSQLEGSLWQWTSYQEDVRQFVGWLEHMEESLDPADKNCPEIRDKTAHLSRAKLLHEEVLSHDALLATIVTKSASIAENYVAQLELQDLQERYESIKDNATGAVGKAEALLKAHEEYQQGLRAFERWLEGEQEKLGCYVQLEGDVDTLEETLQKLQELQLHCTEGQALLNAALIGRESLAPWGPPQMEERVLETQQREWRAYQARLADTRARLNGALAKLRQTEQKFQRLDGWLKATEAKAQPRAHRRSDRATKDAQLLLLETWREEVLVYQEEMEGLGVLAQQVLDETHINSRIGTRATQITARYHALLLHLLETIKQLREEVSCIEEAQSALGTFSDWFLHAQSGFCALGVDVVDRSAAEKTIKDLEALQAHVEQGHADLKTVREKTERAAIFLEETEAEALREEADAQVGRLEDLLADLRTRQNFLDKCVSLSKDFSEKYKAQAQWLLETKGLLAAGAEPKAELYQKKAQLAKYKTIQQAVQSHESAVKCALEKGQVLLEMVRDPLVSEKAKTLQADYLELCSLAKTRVQTLVERVKEHEDYNVELQEVEKWLLQMSSRLVTWESMQTGSVEMATQQLARHKAILEEIASFEERLNSLNEKGEELVASCTEQVQAKISQQIQTHQQGTRDSYSAICSTAQRVHQSLDRELQKHVNHQDTFQQCQTWLAAVREELRLNDQEPSGLQEALKQMKHYRALQEQASTYLDLVCSVCDLSDEAVRTTAGEVQKLKIIIEENMANAQELSEAWREIKEQKQDLSTLFQDMEQQLLSLSRRPAELETKIAQNMLSQAEECSQLLQSKENILATMTEKVNRLSLGQNSPEKEELERLNHSWLDLCQKASSLEAQRLEGLRRSKEYHGCISAVEDLFERASKEWDNLARTDAESSSQHLEALRKLALDWEAEKGTLDELKEQKQKVIQPLNLDDKELVKEQISHFEQRWSQMQNLMERKIQESAVTLEETAQVEARLREARDWAEEQRPALSEAMKMSPPPELAQSFLFDHLSVCSELEAKQLLLAQAVADSDRLLARLGLSERQRLQRLISDTRSEVESLAVNVAQRRKHLSKAFTEKTHFLVAVDQSVSWVQQNAKKAQAEERAALLPEDLAKQVRTCRNVQSSLKAYQSELTSLWSQGRDLMRDANEEERNEILAKLQELQNIFDKTLHRCGQKLQELEKVFVSRKYFKSDLEKICLWIKQADIVTFPEINLMVGDGELEAQLLKYQQIVERAAESENLLLLVQRAGQEILPTLSEVDHCFLDEKLNSLPQQYNNILALAKEKEEKIQQAVFARNEYASFLDVTQKALEELEERFEHLGARPVGTRTEEVLGLRSLYQAIREDLSDLGLAVGELNQKKEGFRSTGQPWRPEGMTRLAGLYNGLRRLVEQKVEHLDETLESFEDQKAMAMQVDSELKATKERLVKVNAETQSAEERLKNYHALAGSLQSADSHLSRLTEQMGAPRSDQTPRDASAEQVVLWREELRSLQNAVGDLIQECENRFVQSKDFETEVQRTLAWLRQASQQMGSAVTVDTRVEQVQEEIRKQQIMQEEVRSRLRIVAALSSREKDKYAAANELVPEHLDAALGEMAQLQEDVQKQLCSKQVTLEEALLLCQKYHFRMQAACEWLEDAVSFLQRAGSGVDVENYEECFREQNGVVATEQEFLAHLEELENLLPRLGDLLDPVAKGQLRLSVESARERGLEVRDRLRVQQEVLQSCVDQWKSYQEARQTVIELMNQAEKKLTQFSTAKAATGQEAEEKLHSHQSLVSLVNGFQEKLSSLEEQAGQLEQVGSEASKATISRSMTTVWQRWSRLRSVARGQERILADTAQEWRTFREKMSKVGAAADELRRRVPDSAVEKASEATLRSLLERYDVLSQDVERELSSLTLLRQYALSLLHDVEVPSPTGEQDELPGLKEIRMAQEQLDGLLTLSRTKRAQAAQELREREEVERELGVVKAWIQETRELLFNPSPDIDSLLQELETVHADVMAYRQNVDKLAERQQSKYLDLYTILPSEISMQLAEVSLALGAIEDQVLCKERDIQKSREIREGLTTRIHQVSEKLKTVSDKFQDKAPDVDQAKEEVKSLAEDLERCGRHLSELDSAVRELGRRDPLQAKQLGDAVGKLSEMHRHTARLADCRGNWLKKQAVCYLDEYRETLDSVATWCEKAENLLRADTVWDSSMRLQEQMRNYQAVLRDSSELHGDLESMEEKVELLSEVLQTEAMSRRVCELSRRADELQRNLETRLQSLDDAEKSLEALECEVKALHGALEQVQSALTSPELARQSLKEQLTQRQRLMADMESLKRQVQAVQLCQSALRVPEEAMPELAVCHAALRLQQEASRSQHVAIQQCNILQEAVVQYEQYEQEVRELQGLIEDAHRVIQDRPVTTGDIQELQAQILHHEELAQKIKSYQEQIASLNSKCKMLAVKAKHAALLLTIGEDGEIGNQREDPEEMPGMVMAAQCHALMSPLSVESGEEGDASGVSSPRGCRSPSPPTYGNKAGLKRAPVQVLYDPTLESAADLDDLQRSWETLKNVISEKQRTLYEALEKQQRYQASLQSISSKMEALETKLSQPTDADAAPDAFQVLLGEMASVQEDVERLQSGFRGDEAASAERSSVAVLVQRMATIRAKARLSQELTTDGTLALQRDENQLSEEPEWRAAATPPVSEDQEWRDNSQFLQDSTLETEDGESDSSLSQSPGVQDWVAEARNARSQQHRDTLQSQRELEEQLAEQKKLLQSVASRGEEILIRQASPASSTTLEPFSSQALAQKEADAARQEMRQRWESLRQELQSKTQLLQKNLEQDQQHTGYSCGAPLLKEQLQADASTLETLYDNFRQTLQKPEVKKNIQNLAQNT
ncbi:nesprin-1 [Stigmatopora nigra]